LIVDRDRFGVVHSEQDFDGGINAHVMDKGADCVIASQGKFAREVFPAFATSSSIAVSQVLFGTNITDITG
jgi:hypothetical protein